jgi:hypothetical protein
MPHTKSDGLPKAWKTPLLIVSGMLLSLVVGIWVGSSLFPAKKAADLPVTDITANTLQPTSKFDIMVGNNVHASNNLSGLADIAMQQDDPFLTGVIYYSTDTFTAGGNSYTFNQFNVQKCMFGMSIITGTATDPVITDSVKIDSYQSTNTLNKTMYSTTNTAAFALGSTLQYTYANYSTFGSPVEIQTASGHNRMMIYLTGKVSNLLADGQRFQWDGFECQVTIDGVVGTFLLRQGRGISGSTSPLLTFIVGDAASSSATTSSATSSAGTSSATSSASSTASSATSSSTSSAAALNPRIDIFRFYRAGTGGHLYTVSISERDKIINTLSSTYKYEGIRNKVLPAVTTIVEPNMVKVERFFNIKSGTHRYTYNPSLIATLKANSAFKAEGIRFTAFSAAAAGRLPMYEFYNSTTGGYFYTASESEKSKVLANIPQMKYQGIVFYVLPK